MTTTKANIIDCILNDLEELYVIALEEDSPLLVWLNSAPKKVCEQLNHALESTTEEMAKLNADYSKLSELMYDISVPYNDGDLSDHYVDLRLDKLNSILKPVGFEGDEIY